MSHVYDEQQLRNAYPVQDDPNYWEKVPQLFQLEFANKEKLKSFKSNWVVHRVPLYLTSFDTVVQGYMSAALKLIVESLPEKQHSFWLDLFREPVRGHTQLEFYNQTTRSFNVQHQANGKDYSYLLVNAGFLRSVRVHNILQFELATGKKIKDYDIIIEVGGGIGEFARIARDVGFQGRYYDIDFTPMCEINMYNNEYDPRNSYVNHVSQLPDFTPESKILFIGTWSFSELPVSYRDEIVAKIPATCDWLLTVQSNVMNIDNDNYFEHRFAPRTNKRIQKFDIPWHTFQGGNYYYFAT